MNRVVQAFGIIFGVCLGVRVAAWLVTPVLPLLGMLAMFALIGYVLVSGPRFRG